MVSKDINLTLVTRVILLFLYCVRKYIVGASLSLDAENKEFTSKRTEHLKYNLGLAKNVAEHPTLT